MALPAAPAVAKTVTPRSGTEKLIARVEFCERAAGPMTNTAIISNGTRIDDRLHFTARTEFLSSRRTFEGFLADCAPRTPISQLKLGIELGRAGHKFRE